MLRLLAQPWLEIVRHAAASFPREACGVLAGAERDGVRTATVAIGCRNAHPDDQTARFLIDPADQCEAQRAARALSLEIVGFFHSHTRGDAQFSATDRAEAWSGVSNLVVAVAGGRVREARSYYSPRRGVEFAEEALELPDCHQKAGGGIQEDK